MENQLSIHLEKTNYKKGYDLNDITTITNFLSFIKSNTCIKNRKRRKNYDKKIIKKVLDMCIFMVYTIYIKYKGVKEWE